MEDLENKKVEEQDALIMEEEKIPEQKVRKTPTFQRFRYMGTEDGHLTLSTFHFILEAILPCGGSSGRHGDRSRELVALGRARSLQS